jgi:hypothetical protein
MNQNYDLNCNVKSFVSQRNILQEGGVIEAQINIKEGQQILPR